MRGAPVLLPGDDERVDDPSAVVHGDQADGAHEACLGVHLDHREMRTERERRAFGLEVVVGTEAGLLVGRQLGDLEPGDGRGRNAHHLEAVVRELDVGGGRLEQAGSQVARLVDHQVGRGAERAAAELQGPRTSGALAAWHGRGVGLDEAHALHRDTELVGHDHREGRRVALPVGRRPDPNGDHAVGVDVHGAELAGASAGHLDVRREADPQLDRVALVAASTLLGHQGVVLADPEHLAERQVEVSDVVRRSGRRLVREGVGLDEVVAADLDGVEVELVGGQVDHPLEHRCGLGAAGAAERAHGCGVREDRHGVEGESRDAVDAVRHHPGRTSDQRTAETGVRAGVADGPHAEPGDRAVSAETELGELHLAATVHRQLRLGAGLGPTRRAAEPAGDGDGDEVLGRDAGLAAERAAHVRRDDPDVLLGDVEHPRHGAARAVRHLGGHVDHERVVRVVDLHEHRVGLDGRHRQPLVLDACADDHLGVVEDARRLGVTLPVGDVRTELLELQGGAVAQRHAPCRARPAAGRSRRRRARPRRPPARVSPRPPRPRCRRRTAPCRRPGAADRTRCSGRRTVLARGSSSSRDVNTSTTPSALRASSMSTLPIRACGKGERTKASDRAPTTLMLSTKVPWPGTSAGSSTRRTLLPSRDPGTRSAYGLTAAAEPRGQAQ